MELLALLVYKKIIAYIFSDHRNEWKEHKKQWEPDSSCIAQLMWMSNR